jgi:3-hydroxybutyryl-CoA dehydratase
MFEAAIGATATFTKTVAESDVYLFAGITGDLSPNHVDEAFMRGTDYGGRIAHGALLVGYMSNCSTAIVTKCGALADSHFPVSLGYDKVRFLAGVRIGDTITIHYRIASADSAKGRTVASVEVKTEDGTLCAAATHIMKWLPRAPQRRL